MRYNVYSNQNLLGNYGTIEEALGKADQHLGHLGGENAGCIMVYETNADNVATKSWMHDDFGVLTEYDSKIGSNILNV